LYKIVSLAPPSLSAVFATEDVAQIIDIRETVPTETQEGLVVVCFSELMMESTSEEKTVFFQRFHTYLAEDKPVFFLNGDDDWLGIDMDFLRRHLPKDLVDVWNAANQKRLIFFGTSYEEVVSSMTCQSLEVGGSYKEACVAKCAINLCAERMICSFEPPFGFDDVEVDEEHRDIQIPTVVISDLMSISMYDRPDADVAFDPEAAGPVMKKSKH